jgi:hypothetical protein
MTFEQEITQAFDTLTERLRGEIDREVGRRAAELAAAQTSRVEEAPPAPAPSPAPAPADDSASLEHLARGFDVVDAAHSLSAILDALLAFAIEDAPDASVWLIRGGRPHRWRADGSAEYDDESSAPLLEDGIPLTIAGQKVAVLSTNGERRTSNDLVLFARYAARSLEARTAFTTARALTQKPAPARGASDDSGSEDETSARRYARLLVSEIKLYHEPAVIDGRRDRDLASRLGGEIARARVMYEERVPVQVRERRDYFHEELVRTLANGDSSLLEVRN